MEKVENWKIRAILICIVGFLFLSLAIGGYFFSNYIVYYQVSQNLRLENNSRALEFFENPPATLYRKYYFFDIQNERKFLNGEKPKVVEKGPYTYRVEWKQKNVQFLDKNNLKYSPVFTLYFEPSMSNGSESDSITFINIPAAGTVNQINYGGFDMFTNYFINHLETKLIIKRSVRELISGYNDPLMELASQFTPNVKNGMFSILKNNGTESQTFVIKTALENPFDIGKIVSWNGQEKLNFWHGDEANKISGTDGTFYPPFLNRSSVVETFSADMCRSYGLVYLRDNQVNGVKTFDFHLPPNIFSASRLEKEGFCQGKCLGNGVLNISTCYGGVSGFISQPHFLNADDSFVQAIDGIQPNKHMHDFIIHFEPTTGVPVAGKIRLQISFYLQPNEDIDIVKNIQPVLLPVIWFEEEIKLNSETSQELSLVAFYVRLVTIIPISLVTTGILLILVSSFVLVRNFMNNSLKKTKRRTNPAEKVNLVNNRQIDC